MAELQFKNSVLLKDKLIAFGFKQVREEYEYTTDILDGLLIMQVKISKNHFLKTKIIDSTTKEEYTLHQNPDATGKFVGNVRQEYDLILKDIKEKCFEKDVFKKQQTRAVILYIRTKYNSELEFLWPKFPENAIVRRKDNKKWYIVFSIISESKLGLSSNQKVEIINLRINPDDQNSLIDYKNYFPGYHMNKKHWCSIILNNNVATDEIYKRIDDSFMLAKK